MLAVPARHPDLWLHNQNDPTNTSLRSCSRAASHYNRKVQPQSTPYDHTLSQARSVIGNLVVRLDGSTPPPAAGYTYSTLRRAKLGHRLKMPTRVINQFGISIVVCSVPTFDTKNRCNHASISSCATPQHHATAPSQEMGYPYTTLQRPSLQPPKARTHGATLS